MAFVPDFSSSQAEGSLTVGTLTDTSTGYSGSGITGRIVYFRKYDGNYLVPSGYTVTYILWPYVAGTGDTLSFNMLDKDYCLDIQVVYLSGSTISTSKKILTLFTGYGNFQLRRLTSALSGNKTTITAKNFWYNKIKLRTILDDADQAVAEINDQTIAQFCLDEAKPLSDNISLFYN